MRIAYFCLILLYLVLIACWIAIPSSLMLNVSLSVFTLALTMLLIGIDHKRYQKIYQTGYFQNFGLHFFSSILIFFVLGVLNYLAYKNPKVWDFTQEKQFSLSDKTKIVLDSLKKPMTFILVGRKAERVLAQESIQLFKNSNSNLLFETIDPDLRPDMIKKYDLKESLALVLSNGEQHRVIYDINETNITSELVLLGREKTPVIYFTQGHGELEMNRVDKDGISLLVQFLEATYRVKTIDLANVIKVPDDADVLVVLGAKSAFLQDELNKIDDYLKNGGRGLFTFDPNFNTQAPPNYQQLLKERGIALFNNIVVDTISHVSGSNGLVPIIKKFNQNHLITKNLVGQVFFPLVAQVGTLTEKAEEYLLNEVAFTGLFPSSWAEVDLPMVAKGKVQFKEEEDMKGPIPVMVTSEQNPLVKTGKRSRVVVFGNSTFVQNSFRNHGSNFDLFLNAIAWLVGESHLISFDNSQTRGQPIFVSREQLGVIFYFAVIFIPLILFATAIYVYRRRRYL